MLVFETRGFIVLFQERKQHQQQQQELQDESRWDVAVHDRRTQVFTNLGPFARVYVSKTEYGRRLHFLVCPSGSNAKGNQTPNPNSFSNIFIGDTGLYEFFSAAPITEFKCVESLSEIWLALDASGCCYVPFWDLVIPAPLGRTCYEVGNPARFARFHRSKL
jgi:hypothetical protein